MSVFSTSNRATSPASAACIALALAMALALAGTVCPAHAAAPEEVEVFHSMAEGPDQVAAKYLKQSWRERGFHWKDFAVSRGGFGLAGGMLRARVALGNPPAVAQIKTPIVREWAARNALVDLDELARAQGWDQMLPASVADAMKHQGRYVAVPLNIHRLNWLWINDGVFKKAGVRVPATWDEFFVAADAIKQAGFIALAHGGQNWQSVLLFESVVLGVGGPAFYRKALVEHDPLELTGPVMEKALLTLRRIKRYTQPSANPHVQSLASAMLAGGEAGMQLTGDWANPELDNTPGARRFPYSCVPTPGSAGSFAYVIDSFAMFKQRDGAKLKGQLDLASTVMSASVQQEFNLRKGSLPARAGVPLDKFPPCARLAAAAFQAAVRANALVPALSMVATLDEENAVREIVSQFWNDERTAPSLTMARLVAALPRR